MFNPSFRKGFSVIPQVFSKREVVEMALTILDEGVEIATRNKLNFIGDLVAATDDVLNNRVDVTISNPDLSGYCPYTGAISNVDLGTHSLTTTGDISCNALATTGQIKTANGTLAAPAYSFSTSASSGIYTYVDGGGHNRIILVDQGVAALDCYKNSAIFPGAVFAGTTFGVKDTLSANYLFIQAGGTAQTTARYLTFDLNNADRTLDLKGDATLNQDVSTTSTPIFGAVSADGFYAGTTVVSSGTITDSFGEISFGDENLTTTGTISTSSLTNSSMTLGSVLFAGAAGIMSQDNAKLFWDNTNDRLGLGITTPGATLDIQLTTTTTTTNPIAFQSILQPVAGASTSKLYTASNFKVATYGSQNYTGEWGSGGIVGASYAAQHSGTGIVSNAYGLLPNIALLAAGTITNAYALYLPNAYKTAGTITNFYGMYIKTPTVATNNYSIYSEGGDNYLGGNLILATRTPASAAAAGTTGTICWDANYIYVCTATNSWKRVAIATW